MDASLRQLVRRRANDRCEYCGLLQAKEPLTFHVEHIIARQHHGPTVQENLALACHQCNSYKGPNLTAIDPGTGQLTRLFNPRSDKWEAHFAEKDGRLIGLTAVGRATVRLLRMNEDGRLELRTAT